MIYVSCGYKLILNAQKCFAKFNRNPSLKLYQTKIKH